MELAFKNKGLRELCESQLKAERAFGMVVAGKLRRRLADLRDALTIDDVVAGSPALCADPKQMTIQLGEQYQLRVQANHVSNPMKEGKINWSKVRRIQILAIEARDE